jgi:UDP-N-acetylmuramyl-tripeptide synthetase
MLLSGLLEALGLPASAADDVVIRHVTRDSREVRPDSAFVAVVGGSTDGHAFVAGSEAAVVFAERPVEGHPRVVVVPDTKVVLAQIAAELAGRPAEKLALVGVTGTNGKTTVTTLAEQMLLAMEVPTGRVGTTGNQVAGVARKTGFTTPEATLLQPLLAEMVAAGTEVALLEVSSIGLAQRRVDAAPFQIGVFTNLTRDHLDFHGTMEAYSAAKAMLFQRLRPAGGAPRALLCADDPAHREMGAPEDAWTYGFAPGADLHIAVATLSPRGLHLEVDTPHGRAVIDSGQVGRHNAQNLTAALGIGLLLGHPVEALCPALGAAAGPPGRLEVVPNDAGLLVLVDYAHSDDALRTVLPTVTELVDGETWVVFGAGGDRDPGKRPRMAAVAEELADHVVLTSDNPRSEDPLAILDALRAGLSRPPTHEDPDREAAIRWTVAHAAPGDAVLIAGKGHETTQEIAGVRHPFDDRSVAAAALEDR